MKLLHDPKTRGWIAVGLLAIVAIGALAPFAFGRDARHLSAFADGAEDMGHVRGELALTGATIQGLVSTPAQLADVAEPSKTLLLVVGPERRYDASEADAIVAFLRAGGNVLLADEGGFGTLVAREAGFAFDGSRVLDTHNHKGDAQLVVANSTLDGRTYHLLFNAPGDLVPLPGKTGDYAVLAQSSPAAYPEGSYRDLNGNGVIDREDASGPFPLVVRTHVGAGTLVLVADTGLFMDQQVDLPGFDNAAYAKALVGSLVPRDGTILVDESRHAPHAPLALLDDAARTLGRATAGTLVTYALLVLLAAGAVVLVLATRATEDWSHHAHDVAQQLPVPENVRADLARAQRMARRRISEKHNIPMEQVAAMSAEQLVALCGDRLLAEAAAGTLRSDPTALFRSFSSLPEATP